MWVRARKFTPIITLGINRNPTKNGVQPIVRIVAHMRLGLVGFFLISLFHSCSSLSAKSSALNSGISTYRSSRSMVFFRLFFNNSNIQLWRDLTSEQFFLKTCSRTYAHIEKENLRATEDWKYHLFFPSTNACNSQVIVLFYQSSQKIHGEQLYNL